MSRIRDTVIFLWVMLLLAADLKRFFSPVHWAISVLPLLLTIPPILRTRTRMPGPLTPLALLFVLSFLLSGFGRPVGWYAVAQAVKLAILLVYVPIFFVSDRRAAALAYSAFWASIFLNVALIFAGATAFPEAAGMKAIGRWGTFINYPGSLWRVGITGLVYSGYLLCSLQRPQIFHILLFSSSLILVVLDGSRTAALLLCVAIVLLLAFLALDGKQTIRRGLIRMVFAATCGVILVIAAINQLGLQNRNIIERILAVVQLERTR
ncbi:MAG: hypothetical protein DDG58_01460, partial [Ardenticatenia bacterium]